MNDGQHTSSVVIYAIQDVPVHTGNHTITLISFFEERTGAVRFGKIRERGINTVEQIEADFVRQFAAANGL